MICFLWDLIQLFKSKPVNVYNSLRTAIQMVSSTGSYLGQSSRSDKTARMTVDRSKFQLKELNATIRYLEI
jgi:hypothetical protein